MARRVWRALRGPATPMSLVIRWTWAVSVLWIIASTVTGHAF